MFQVASHPTAFDKHAYSRRSLSSPAPPHSPAVQLPRTLARPPFVEVSRDAIIAASPELASVPVEYIRRGLRPRANEMLAGISALAPSHMPSSMPRSRLPSSLTIPLRTTSAAQPSYPTHILAVSSSKNPSDQAMMFPVHSLVLASHCAQLPRLPPSHQQPHSPTVHLPVLPLSIPSPAAFAVLHSFMYHHRLEAVLKALFPMPSGFLQSVSHEAVLGALASGSTLHQLSSYLCASASGNLSTLTTHTAHVKELWQDMAALGLHDPELWDTLDLAWEVVLGALNLAAAGK
ncbi:hypothetical protein D9615_003424 [Tricholomella constricta]|uniref:Uncharacterized protein n=1 Tax=Tricholomella constricta TaxID=117010 RepID=A0A8H5HJD6_9AGAR|nr:hypothetical protein D9615_003424 [Tricholomella constricta]